MTAKRVSETKIQRILLVLQSFAIGGMDSHCLDLAAEYVRRGLTVAAVVPEGQSYDDLGDRFRSAGAEVRRITTDPRLGRAGQLRRLLRFARFCKTWAPDAVHLHTGQAHGGVATLALARLATRAAVVFTEHEVPLLSAGEYTWRERAGRQAMLGFAHAVIAVSRRNAALRRERLGAPPQRLAAVLNGVPAAAVDPVLQAQNRLRVRHALEIEAESFVLGCVVRLVEGKGLEDLLRAFASDTMPPGAALLIVGDGPLRESLQRLAEDLGVAARVHFSGYQADPAPYLDALDAFVLAVPSGSMSIALLEAMARGIPPVITFCGPEEAVIPEETGLCAPPNDPTALAGVIARLARDPRLRERLSTAAAEHVARHFSSARVADDLLDLYRAAPTGDVPARLRAEAPPNPWPVDTIPTPEAAEAVRAPIVSGCCQGR